MATVVVLVAACGAAVPSPSASPSALVALRPAIQIDEQWTAADGEWTITGRVDPDGDPTDVVLEVGPGPANARQFDASLPVAQGVTAAGPVTITTRDLPDIDEICVRFTAINSAGSSSTPPLCIPHDPPTAAPPGAPLAEIVPDWTLTDGEWSFIGRIDPKGAATDVILEIGRGPAATVSWDREIPAAQDQVEIATLTITTSDVPDADEICARFTATNALGTASSEPLCVPGDGSSPGPSPSATP